ncbi:tRNA guanosine-2'-O-methyltransferase [Thraustotheca clavata]|uniref:tRNA guanosine-2'-O-methyltransferase n=1 Tax=Thraustotheca clavata TaxID=74557 RepID=A0A1V9YYW4_9STRA|nr:tRNA guanosine-2'-O-methyltransferase [Thraustotheca clavata]
MPTYLIYFIHRYLDFRHPELDAVLELNGIVDVSTCYELPETAPKNTTHSPFLIVNLASDAVAQQLAARCVLIKGIYQYITHTQASSEDSSASYADLRRKIASLPWDLRKNAMLDDESTWSLQVDCFGKRLSLQEQNTRRDEITEAVPLCGDIHLKQPARTYWLLEEKGILPSEVTLKRIFFAKSLNIIRFHGRDFVDKHQIKKRKFIGPTTMDHELSLIMANIAKVGPGTIACDPFVGTASVLVASAQFGAMCVGGDIEMQGLYRKENSTIAHNFEQYDLPCPDFIQWDLSQQAMCPRPFLDAIVCDPPYGLRAGARKCSANPKKKPFEVYEPSHVLTDLLHWAALRLVLQGRLVYVLACKTDPNNEYDDQIPRHPSLKVLHVCVQNITQKLVRLFITMVKVKEVASNDVSTAATLDVGW